MLGCMAARRIRRGSSEHPLPVSLEKGSKGPTLEQLSGWTVLTSERWYPPTLAFTVFFFESITCYNLSQKITLVPKLVAYIELILQLGFDMHIRCTTRLYTDMVLTWRAT